MIKKLARSIRQYKKAAILSVVLILLEAALEVVIPFLSADLIDNGVEAGNISTITRLGIYLLLAALASLTVGAVAGAKAADAATGFARNLRQDMYYALQDFSFSNIDKFSTASIVTRLTTDVQNVQMSFMMIIRMGVLAPAMMLFSLFMAFSINPQVSLVILGAIPILALTLFLIFRNAHPIIRRVFKTYDKLNNVVQENLRGVRVVKSFVREDYEIRKFEDVSQSIFKDFSKAEKLIAFNMPAMQFAIYTAMLLVSWVGAKLIVGGSMTTGQLVSLFSYVMMILMNIMMLSMVFVMIVISRTSAERIVELLDEKPDLANKNNPVYEVKNGAVTFQNVNFSYSKDKEKLCLFDVDLDIQSGETIGIIGGTGSSKSTLVQLIPRLYDVTSGSISVGGVDVRDYDIQSLRNAVAMVLQKNVLFSGTIKENLRWGDPDATDEELVEACKLAQAHDFIQSFPDGYDTHIEQGGTNVSGGQKQRLTIARALLKKPKILILDDSTSAVDTQTEAQLQDAFNHTIPDTTKFIISQRISSVRDADRIIVMDGGRVNAFGTHDELLESNTIYQEVFNSQIEGGDFDEAH